MTIDKTQPLVSIIVPVYKVEKYLRTCLDSILAQSYTHWEAILVDDGSPDRSGAICDEYAGKDHRFKVIHKENGGLSSARNEGVKYAVGEYVFYLDSDDFIHNDAFHYLIQLAMQYNADIVQCNFLYGDQTQFPVVMQQEEISVYDKRSIFTSFRAKIVACGKLYRKSIIDSFSFPVGYINEDDFTVWKYYYRSDVIVITNQPYYYYTYNPQGIMSTQRNVTSARDLRYFKAYEERISFFMEKNEKDLEAVSRIQWMKSLVVLASSEGLSKEQRELIMNIYKTNYSALKSLSFKPPFKLSILFRMFPFAPKILGKIANYIYMHS